MTKVQIITPKGTFGGYDGEHVIATAMRIIGVGFGDPEDWCAKYGANYENDTFLMKRFCWCEKAGEVPVVHGLRDLSAERGVPSLQCQRHARPDLCTSGTAAPPKGGGAILC